LWRCRKTDLLALITAEKEKIGFELVVAFCQTIALYWPAKGVFRLSAGNRECQTGESGRLHGAGPSVRNQRLVLFLPTHFPVMPAKKLYPSKKVDFAAVIAILSIGHLRPLVCSFLLGETECRDEINESYSRFDANVPRRCGNAVISARHEPGVTRF